MEKGSKGIGDRGEQCLRAGPDRCDGDDAYDGDEGQHEAVLDHRGTLLTLDDSRGSGDELAHETVSW